MSEKTSVKSGTVRVEIPAYAKINLYLDVLGCRDDGFHELLTVMHAISLHDDIIVQYTPAPVSEISLRIFGSRLIALVYIAAREGALKRSLALPPRRIILVSVARKTL